MSSETRQDPGSRPVMIAIGLAIPSLFGAAVILLERVLTPRVHDALAEVAGGKLIGGLGLFVGGILAPAAVLSAFSYALWATIKGRVIWGEILSTRSAAIVWFLFFLSLAASIFFLIALRKASFLQW